MTSQGPPLRFKAVNTDTGESSEHLYDIFRIVSTNHILHLQVADYNCDKFTFRFNNPSFNSRPKAKVEICQSTGLHDAKGREIFFGDVLLSDIHGFNTVVWDPVDCECRLQNDAGAISYINSDTSKECNTRVIGNRHESREVLEQREKEVIGGA